MSEGVCRYWAARGSCFYGDKCKFLHESPVAVPNLQEVPLQSVGETKTLKPSVAQGIRLGECMERTREEERRRLRRGRNRSACWTSRVSGGKRNRKREREGKGELKRRSGIERRVPRWWARVSWGFHRGK